MTFKTIFWDNDGTLVDTEPSFLRATQEALKKVDFELTEKWFIDEQLKRGASIFDLVRSTNPNLNDENIQELRRGRDELHMHHLKSEVRIMDGVLPTLEALHGKVPMAIVTSSKRPHLEAILAGTGLAKYFDFFITSEDVLHEKPDPEPYLIAWAKSGFQKEECLVIEDTERGVTSAKAAGLTCFAIPNQLSKHNDFSQADRILKRPEEILDFL